MAEVGEVFTRKIRIYEETHAEWKISEFFRISEFAISFNRFYRSSTFFIAGVPFLFTLFPRNQYHPDSALIVLNSPTDREFLVEFNFGLRKLDGSLEQISNGKLEKNEIFSNDVITELVVSELLQRKSDLVPEDVLTVTCILKVDTAYSTETTEMREPNAIKLIISELLQRKSDLVPEDVLTVTCILKVDTAYSTEMREPNAIKLIKLDKLSENFGDFFASKETCDVTLKVEDREYRAHKSILMARSKVFAANFKHDTLENQTGIITITDCDSVSFQKFLEYLYTGKLEQLSIHSAINLYYTSDKYDVQELKAFCVEYLMQCVTVETVSAIVAFADKFDETQLFKVAQEFFNRNYLKIFLSSEWKDLMKENYLLASKLLEEISK